MAYGPVELRVIEFPDNRFRGEILPAVVELVEKEIVRVIDILFVEKAEDGRLSVFEMNDLDDDDYRKFDPVVADVTGFLSNSDVEKLSVGIPNNSSAAILLFEELWPNRFKQAVESAQGKLVWSESISAEIIDDLETVPSDGQ
jgi:hypothetical protein